jgi:Lsr2
MAFVADRDPKEHRGELTVAKEVLTVITDDIDGSKNAQPVTFALEGTEYTVDLVTWI